MAYLNKNETREVKSWSLEDGNKIQILKVEACINEHEERYISIVLKDEDNDIVEDCYIDLEVEYENYKCMERHAKALRQELCRKMDLYSKDIEILNSQI